MKVRARWKPSARSDRSGRWGSRGLGLQRGSYAEYALVPDAMLVKIPDGVDFQMAAAPMLQGMTAHT